MSYGFNGFIGVGKETSWGSAVAASEFFEAFTENLQLSLDRFVHRNMTGQIGEPEDNVGINRISGSIVCAAHPQFAGRMLKGVLQSATVTSLTGPIYRTDFVTTSGGGDFSSEVPSQPYTIEVYQDATSSMQFAGCVVEALTMDFRPNQAVQMTAEFIGRSDALIAKSSPTFVSTPSKPFMFDTVSLSIGGAGTALIEDLTIKISNGYQGLPALNLSSYIAKVRRGAAQTIEVNGTLDFYDYSQYLQFKNQSVQRLTVSATRASSFQLIVDIPRFIYQQFPVQVGGRDRITVAFMGHGYYDTGSLNAIKVSLFDVRTY